MADRYVDDKGKPLPYTPQYPYAKHPSDEFKRMPIHLSFVMDQRRLPKLLVECANSTMPIEVQYIRILKVASTAGAAGQTSGSAPSKSGEGAGGLSSGDDREVEICGVIYIYNPPDRAKLGVAASAEKPAERRLLPARPPPQPPQRLQTPPRRQQKRRPPRRLRHHPRQRENRRNRNFREELRYETTQTETRQGHDSGVFASECGKDRAGDRGPALPVDSLLRGRQVGPVRQSPGAIAKRGRQRPTHD